MLDKGRRSQVLQPEITDLAKPTKKSWQVKFAIKQIYQMIKTWKTHNQNIEVTNIQKYN